MPASLFTEQDGENLAFYINGELQFHTSDEHIYHEYLVNPAIALAALRFPSQPLRVLICGGGDGLAAREVLRFSEVSHIDLVDYDPAVVELGKTIFSDRNRQSLSDPKLIIHSQDAFEFLLSIKEKENLYHAIVCDFTFPTHLEDTRLHGQEWFELVSLALHSGGILGANAVSSDRHARGFWCIYRTLLASKFDAKPMRVEIPSFQRHGYGVWGFFLASDRVIKESEIVILTLPTRLQELSLEKLRMAFVFDGAIANIRYTVTINSLASSQLFYYLLNPLVLESSLNNLSKWDSLAQTESYADLTTPDSALDTTNLSPLQLESLAKIWLTQLELSPQSFDLEALLPVQHPYHTAPMLKEWIESTQQLLAQIDLLRLFQTMQARAKGLPAQTIRDLQALAEKLKDINNFPAELSQPIAEIEANSATKTAAQVLMMLSLTLLVANIIAPDAVFAKGSYSGSSGDSGDGWGPVGLMMTFGGIFWLISLANNSSQNRDRDS